MISVTRVGERYSIGGLGARAATWRRFRRNRTGMLGVLVLLMIILSVVVVPLVSPFGYDDSNEFLTYAPFGTFSPMSGHTHWFGTDAVGRDLATRLFWGGGISLIIGFSATLAMVIIGTLLGAVAGFFGGWVDTLIMRFVDFLLALPLVPAVLLVPMFIAQIGPFSWVGGPADWTRVIMISLALALLGWMGLARQVRASILTLRALSYVEATRALGAGSRRIILRHLIPNSLTPILVSAVLAVGDFIIFESILSYLRYGVPDPLPSLGNLLQQSQDSIWVVTSLNPAQDIRAYLMLLPGLFLLVTVLSINAIGEALRSAFDPYSSGS